MSNRFEIQEELTEAQDRLTELCKAEAKECKARSVGTVTIEPKFGEEMTHLREKCSQLNMILEAMDASED